MVSSKEKTANLVEFLSEDTVKRAMLQFMKTHYKHHARHPERGETLVSFDKKTPDGTIIDGALEFTKEDGNRYLATFEATSLETQYEVRYTLQKDDLRWDTIATTAIGATLMMLIFSRTDTFSLLSLGWVGSLFLLFLVGLFVFLVVQSILRPLSRYRYIFGVDRFKKYAADDQWIALSQDVFADPNDPNYLELKRQCVVNGFGLVTVNRNEQIQLVLTPSREKILRNRPDVWSKVTDRLDKVEQNIRFNQRNRPYLLQQGLVFFSAVLLFMLFQRQQQANPIAYVQKDYQQQLTKKSADMAPEPAVYPQPAPDDPITSVPPKPQPNTGATELALQDIGLATTTPEGIQYYPCSRVSVNLGDQNYYAVYWGIKNSFEEATSTMKDLNAAGFHTNFLCLRCYKKELSGYLIYFNDLHSQKDVANKTGMAVINQLKAKKLIQDNSAIRIYKLESF